MGIFVKQFYAMTAAALVATAPQARADDGQSASGSTVGVSAERQQGCALLFGACEGERTSLAVRLGDPAKRSEFVFKQTEFNEQTRGGVGRGFPVTYRGQRYGAVDFALGGTQQLQGTVRGVEKSFPLGDNGVVTFGGYYGTVKGTIGASAELGVTVDALKQRFAIGTSYRKDGAVRFGGLTEASLWSAALPQPQSFAALTQSLNAGVDRAQGSIGLGYVYAQNSADRALLRSAGREITVAGVPKGTVLTVHASLNRVFFDPVGDKGMQKLEAYAESINARGRGYTEQYGIGLPQVTATQLARLVGREVEPKTSCALQLGVVVPLGANSGLSLSTMRASNGRRDSRAAFNLQF